jgi:hypothetical protein
MVGSRRGSAKGLALLGRSGHFMSVWGHVVNWMELAIVWLLTFWLLTFAIGIAIYFVQIARLLDGLIE